LRPGGGLRGDRVKVEVNKLFQVHKLNAGGLAKAAAIAESFDTLLSGPCDGHACDCVYHRKEFA
jgi:hypothetical protein